MNRFNSDEGRFNIRPIIAIGVIVYAQGKTKVILNLRKTIGEKS
jgi:hypothetical protein